MQFIPKTDDEIAAEMLIAPGDYDFQVREAVEETSKKGNDMIHLKLSVWDADGNERWIDDYLLEVMAFKLRHFAYAVGLDGLYESGSLTAGDCTGKSGKCSVFIDKGDGNFRDKNAIKDYVVPDEQPAAPSPRPPATNGNAAVKNQEASIADRPAC